MEGVSYKQNLFCASSFVFVPQIACRDCGSLSHKRCGKRLCFHCGEAKHEACSCVRELLVNRCHDAHWRKECPAFVEEMKLAYEKKQDSYWKFLLDSHDTILQDNTCANSDVEMKDFREHAKICPKIHDDDKYWNSDGLFML